MKKANPASFFVQGTESNKSIKESIKETNREILSSLISSSNADCKKIIFIGEDHYEHSAKLLLLENMDLLENCRIRNIKPVILLEHISARFNPILLESCKNKEFDFASLTPSKENGHEIKPWDPRPRKSVFNHPKMAVEQKNFVSQSLLAIIEEAIKKGIPILGAENKQTGFGYLPYGYFGKEDIFNRKRPGPDVRDYVRLRQGNLAFTEEITAALASYDLIIFLGGCTHIADIKFAPDLKLDINPNWWGPVTFTQEVKGLKSLLLESNSDLLTPDNCITWSCRDGKKDNNEQIDQKNSSSKKQTASMFDYDEINYDIVTFLNSQNEKVHYSFK